MPRQRPPCRRKTFQSISCAGTLPRALTHRGYMFATSGCPCWTSSTSRTSAARTSSGSNPATTTGSRWRSTNGRKTSDPVMAAAWPAARKPSTLLSGISATISIAGGMYLWAESTEKFAGTPAVITAAVATAVVSNPLAKKTTSSPGRASASSTACVTEYTLEILPPSAAASASERAVPGTRSMSPYVAMCTPCRASAMASSISGQSVTHTGQPGPMITVSCSGKVARSPNRAMACSWLPQTCITETGRPIASTAR